MTSRPRILYLTTRVPYPPNRGDRIRSYHTLLYLAERADVSLASLADEPWTDEQHEELSKHCQQIFIAPHWSKVKWLRAMASLAMGRSATEGLFASASLRRKVAHWAHEQSFDAVLVFCSSMYQYASISELAGCRRVVDLVDVDSEKWKQYSLARRGPKSWLYGLESRRNRRLEQRIVKESHATYLVSEDEADVLRQFAPGGQVLGIGNGVDLEYFKPGESTQQNSPSCVFVGGMDYPPNIEGVCWFAAHVWPEVHRRHPDLRFVIVGRDPVSEVLELREKHPNIEVTGSVPDVRPYIRDATFVVAPLQIARGLQNKVLEAMAMGKPVIATPEALTGIELTAGEHAMSANNTHAWHQLIARCLHDKGTCQQIGQAAHRLIESSFSWSAQLNMLIRVLDIST